MRLQEVIINDFKTAFKEKNLVAKGVLSLLQSEIKNREIETAKREEGLSDEEVVQLVQKAVKQRKDSIKQYAQAGRVELVESEQAELAVLEKYLPKQLGVEELELEIKQIIQQLEAEGAADFGKVMGAAMGALKGKADGDKVKEIVQKLLAS